MQKLRIAMMLAMMTNLLLVSCKSRQAPSADGDASLSDLSVNLPGNVDSNGKVLFDVYSIEIKASSTTPECLASQVAQGDLVPRDTSKSLALSGISVKRNCNYELVVDLGIGGLNALVESKLGVGNNRKIVADKRSYSSNVPGKGRPIPILAVDMQKSGKSYRVPQIVVHKINASGIGPEELKPGEDADLDIDIRIGDQPPLDPPKTMAANKLYYLTDGNHLERVVSTYGNTQRLFIQFSSQQCSDCTIQKNTILEMVKTLPASNNTVFLYLDDPDQATLAKYGVSLYPTNFLFVASKVSGKVVGRMQPSVLNSVAKGGSI
jgi:hypothetical protein